MILAIDIGNTRLKWGVFSDGDTSPAELQMHGACLNQAFAEVPEAWRGCTQAVMCNVASEGMAEAVGKAIRTLGIPCYEVKSSTEACALKNNYDQPEKLGTDRWAALVAAWQHYQKPCVVVNAGTAITVDVINLDARGKGLFVGGMILPGIRLMQQSLLDSTAGIKESMGEWQDFPTNTANAVFTAAMTAAAGNVKGMAARLQHRTGTPPLIVIAGGDAELLAECLLETIHMENKLVIADNLVLQGLLLLEKASR